MKLKTALKGIGCSNIKLGAASGFIYCGVPSVATIKRVSEEKRAETIQQMDYILRHLYNFDTDIKDEVISVARVSTRDFIRANQQNIEKYGADFLETSLVSIIGEKTEHAVCLVVDRELDRIEKLAALAQSFSPWVGLLEREVREIYWSEDEPDTKIILVEGSEVGKFWTTEEYQRGVAEEDGEEE